MEKILNNLNKRISMAVSHYWQTREQQANKQKNSGRADQGLRSAVTGGAQMDGFISLITGIILEAGVMSSIYSTIKILSYPDSFALQKNGICW